jgi:hypothetical protein
LTAPQSIGRRTTAGACGYSADNTFTSTCPLHATHNTRCTNKTRKSRAAGGKSGGPDAGSARGESDCSFSHNRVAVGDPPTCG